MGMKNSRMPAHLQSNRDQIAADLAKLGLSEGGSVALAEESAGGEEGLTETGLSDEADPGLGEGTLTQTVDRFGKLQEETTEEDHPGEAPADSSRELPDEAPKENPKGLEKREVDARDAQRAMSRTQVKLDATEKRIDEKFKSLSEMIARLTKLQGTVGQIPEDFPLASDETMATWKKDYVEALSVINTQIAPVYRLLSTLQEQVNQLVSVQTETYTKARAAETLDVVYAQIPQPLAKRIAESQEFFDWYQDQPVDMQPIIKRAIEATDTVDPKTTLKIYRDFSRDTGIQIPGLDETPAAPIARPRMDTHPSLRGGGPRVRVRTPIRANDTTAPLSIQELNNYQALLAQASEPEKAILRKRMALTSITLNGENPQSLK